MAAALRRGLMDTATARRAAAGADSHKDRVYGYLTGAEFRARVQGIVEPVIEMRNSLEAEKRAAARQFAARDKQIERVVAGMAGMYGDLQGLVGPSLPTVDGLALPEPDGGRPARAGPRFLPAMPTPRTTRRCTDHDESPRRSRVRLDRFPVSAEGRVRGGRRRGRHPDAGCGCRLRRGDCGQRIVGFATRAADSTGT